MYIRKGYDEDYRELRKGGFLPSELKSLIKGLHEPLPADLRARMASDRLTWVTNMRKQGLKVRQINEQIKKYYKKPKRDVFDFLRAGYDYKKKAKLTEAEFLYMERKKKRTVRDRKSGKKIFDFYSKVPYDSLQRERRKR